MLEREAKREKTLESIAREKRLKAAQKRPNSGAAKQQLSNPNDEVIKTAQDEPFAAIDDGSGAIREEAAKRLEDYKNL